METLKKWAAYFTADYDGRFRNPPGDWEDLIGPVTLKCVPGGKEVLKVTIKSLEVSGWRGILQPMDKVLTIFTDRKGARFDCVFRESPDGRGGSFVGKLREAKRRHGTEISLTMKRSSGRPGRG